MRVDRGKLVQIEHDRKLREYLRENLDSLIQRQKLVKDGRVRTSLSTLDLPTLRYARPGKKVLARGSRGGPQGQSGKAQGSQGQDGGEEVIELSGRAGADDHADSQTVEMDFEEFVRLAQDQLLEDLELPPIGRSRLSGEVAHNDEDVLQEIDRPGLPADLDLERTMFESLKRSLRETGSADYDLELKRDGWYFTDVPEGERTTRALEVYLLDISGSVSGHNIALIRKFIFILWYYLDRRYATNARRFVVFQDEAEEVTRDAFFAIESKGGTHISSGLELARTVLEGHAQYDRYLFFFSDGDNSSSDDESAADLFSLCLEDFDMVCYGRINPCDSPVSPFNKLVREKLDCAGNLTFNDIRDLDNVRETVQGFLRVLKT